MTNVLLSHIEKTIVRYITTWDTDPTATAAKNSKMESKGKGIQSIILNVEQFISDIENRPAIWNRNYHCNKSFLEQTWIELATIYKLPKESLKAKWKALRDNFRVEYKRIPRNEAGEMLITPDAHNSKWMHYYSLLFLSDHMRQRSTKYDSVPLFYQPPTQCDDDDYEETLVEPDLTTGLITFDDEDDDDYDEDDGESSVPNIPSNLSIHLRPAQTSESNSNDSAIYSSEGSRKAGSYAASISTVSTTSSTGAGPIPPLLNPLKRKRGSNESGDVKTEVIDLENLSDPDDDYYYLLSLHPYMKQLNASQKLRLRTKIQKLIFKELYKEDIDEGK